jgi:hypothetical protein
MPDRLVSATTANQPHILLGTRLDKHPVDCTDGQTGSTIELLRRIKNPRTTSLSSCGAAPRARVQFCLMSRREKIHNPSRSWMENPPIRRNSDRSAMIAYA